MKMGCNLLALKEFFSSDFELREFYVVVKRHGKHIPHESEVPGY
jgi:hypothetical protein